MNNRSFRSHLLLTAVLLATQACSSSSDNTTSSPEQVASNKTQTPNIIMIISDDLGRQDLSLYGSTLYETPNIDQLASDGVTFNNAYVSHPRCVPSRISILSGQDSARMGSELIKKAHHLPPEKVTFAEHLQQAGYQTGYIGKWHLGQKNGGWPQHQGFDESILAGSAGAPDSYFYPFGFKSKKGKETFGSATGNKGEFLTTRLTKEANGFIKRHQASPFLLVLSHYSVHTPIEAQPETVEYYRDKLKAQGETIAHKRKMPDLAKGRNGISEYKTKHNNPTYAAMVDAVDKSVGAIVKQLEGLNLTDNTVIIFTSDHGGLSSRGPNNRELATSNLPFRQGKGWLYDGGIRVPLIVKWPSQVKAGHQSQVQVTGTDHYPTLLQLANMPLSSQDHKDGSSYLRAMFGENYLRPPFFYHSPIGRPGSTGDTNASAVIDGDWKLIDWFDDNQLELFNLKQDPSESVNLASQHPEKRKELQQKLKHWLSDVNAQYRKPGQKMKWDVK